MVRHAGDRRASAATAAKTTTASSTRIRRTHATTTRYNCAAGSLRLCRSHSKAKNKNRYRNQLSHQRPFFGAPPPGTPRQARNFSSYAKTTQQRENGLSVPWVLTKFHRDFSRTRQSLFSCIGGLGAYLDAPCVFRSGPRGHAWEIRDDFHSAPSNAGRGLRR